MSKRAKEEALLEVEITAVRIRERGKHTALSGYEQAVWGQVSFLAF